MGLACIRGLAEKFGEKLLGVALDRFQILMDKSTDSGSTVGVCRVLFNIASAASFKLLITISPKIISILGDNLYNESLEIREWTAKIFVTLFQKQPEKSFIDPILDKSILYTLK